MALRGIYYDTETTGLRAREDRIIELAAYDPERDATFEALINPGVPIPAQASAVHKITDDMVAKAPTFEKVALDFVDFCDGEIVLIAHNNDGFDRHFIKAEYERSGVTLPEWKYLDTLKWARRYRPDLPKHNLQFLRQTYGIAENNAHRALDDVVVLHQIFSVMIDDLTFEQVMELMASAGTIDRMPFGKHQGLPLDQVPKNYPSWLKKSGALDKPQNKELLEALEQLSTS